MTSQIRCTVNAFIAFLCFAVVTIGSGCSKGNNTFGGGPTPTPTPAPRMLVSDNTSGNISVVDATNDTVTHTLAVPSPGKMLSAGGVTLIQSTLSSTVTIFDNATETIRFTVPLATLPVDIALTPDGKTAWVALNNGTAQSIDTATGVAAPAITITGGVQRLVMGPQGTNVLAFNDALAINFTVIKSGSPIELGNLALDHPTYGFFNSPSDDNLFFILDCGAECGGKQAGIAAVTFNAPGGPFIGTPVAVSGATIAQLNGTTSFVAGSPTAGLNAGTLQTFNTSSNTAGTPVSIADGRHTLMALVSNVLYVGSTGCTLGAVNPQNFRQGCLTIFNTVSQVVTPVLLPAGRPNGDVTGLAPINARNLIYVVQGGTLDIFDVTTNAVSTTAKPPIFPGTVFGVVKLSP